MQKQRQTMVADYAIRGRLAYLSHQETLALFQRALLRAEVPVAFSGGFNPRPRLSIPLPRSVGTQSGVERFCALLECDEKVDTENLKERLCEQLPEGCDILSAVCYEGKTTFHPVSVRYRFCLANSPSADRLRHIKTCQDDILTDRSIEVQRWRAKKKLHQRYDISPFVERLDLSENSIDVSCRVSQQGSVRIDELMQWLQLNVNELKEPVKRTAIQWDKN